MTLYILLVVLAVLAAAIAIWEFVLCDSPPARRVRPDGTVRLLVWCETQDQAQTVADHLEDVWGLRSEILSDWETTGSAA